MMRQTRTSPIRKVPPAGRYQFMPPRTPVRADAEEGGGDGLAAGTVAYQILYWDGAAWVTLNLADADYKVLQRKVDDTLGWDYVRAHA